MAGAPSPNPRLTCRLAARSTRRYPVPVRDAPRHGACDAVSQSTRRPPAQIGSACAADVSNLELGVSPPQIHGRPTAVAGGVGAGGPRRATRGGRRRPSRAPGRLRAAGRAGASHPGVEQRVQQPASAARASGTRALPRFGVDRGRARRPTAAPSTPTGSAPPAAARGPRRISRWWRCSLSALRQPGATGPGAGWRRPCR